MFPFNSHGGQFGWRIHSLSFHVHWLADLTVGRDAHIEDGDDAAEVEKLFDGIIGHGANF